MKIAEHSIAAKAVTFFVIVLFFIGTQDGFAVWLDPKVTKRSRQKKASPLQAKHSGPLFCQAFVRIFDLQT